MKPVWPHSVCCLRGCGPREPCRELVKNIYLAERSEFYFHNTGAISIKKKNCVVTKAYASFTRLEEG